MPAIIKDEGRRSFQHGAHQFKFKRHAVITRASCGIGAIYADAVVSCTLILVDFLLGRTRSRSDSSI
jgi:hypothetical protein